MPKGPAEFDADDSLLSGALARTNGKMLALQSRIAKFAAAFIAIRAAAGVVTAGFDHFRQALNVGGKLSDLSANTGVPWAISQQEFANAGKSAEGSVRCWERWPRACRAAGRTTRSRS